MHVMQRQEQVLSTVHMGTENDVCVCVCVG